MATYNSSWQSTEIDAAIDKFYTCRNRITVKAPIGSFVTASCSGATLTSREYYLDDTNSLYYFYFDRYGTWNINATNNSDVYNDQILIDELKDYFCDLSEQTSSSVDSVLNNNDWAVIQTVAQNSEGSSYWSVGDIKSITLNGNLGRLTLSNQTFYTYIIGFDHNSELEGTGITFQLGKSALSDGVDIALVDNYNGSTGANGFNMNNSSGNGSGWEGSRIRQTVCDVEFLQCLDSSVGNCFKEIYKYTDNIGGGTGASGTSAAVYSTQDFIFLLAEYEVFGNQTYANSYEQNYQQQYSYYINNSKVKYSYADTSSAMIWLLRSPYPATDNRFVAVDDDGTVRYLSANISEGFSPAFVIG